jgi:hypothetical protein
MDITSTPDWDVLMTMVNDADVQHKKVPRVEFTDNIKQVVQEFGRASKLVLAAWLHTSKQFEAKAFAVYEKNVVLASDLKGKRLQVYKDICRQCPNDEDMLLIENLISDGPLFHKKTSGRTIDTLVTRFPKYTDVSYYLDVTDTKKTYIVDYPSADGRTIILFDISSSYRSRMHQYTKTYFDCFGRGDVIEHTLQSGKKLRISLCQFTFFIWAHKFKVFEYLKKNFQKVIKVRQYSQRKAYKPKKISKRKMRNEPPMQIEKKNAVLCPVRLTCDQQGSHRLVKKMKIVMTNRDTSYLKDFNFKKRLLYQQKVPSLKYFLE